MAPIARPPDRDHTDSQKRLHRRRGLSRWWLHRSPRIKGWRLLAVPMVAFITVIAASLALQLQERSQRRVAITAAAVTRTANQVLTDAVNAEAGVSGFAATGDPTILTPYTDAVQRL